MSYRFKDSIVSSLFIKRNISASSMQVLLNSDIFSHSHAFQSANFDHSSPGVDRKNSEPSVAEKPRLGAIYSSSATLLTSDAGVLDLYCTFFPSRIHREHVLGTQRKRP